MNDDNDTILDAGPALPPAQRVQGKAGRNLKWFMPFVTEKILDAIRSGATKSLAAQYAGISDTTLSKWLKQGEEAPDGDPLHEFYIEFHRARGEKAKITLDRIQQIAESVNSWQGLAWILEHSYPKEFGRGIFGGDPNEAPEIKHVIEIVRRDDDPIESIETEHRIASYDISQLPESTGSTNSDED